MAQNNRGVRPRWRVPPPYTTEPECALPQVIPSFPLRAFPSSVLTPFPPPAGSRVPNAATARAVGIWQVAHRAGAAFGRWCGAGGQSSRRPDSAS